MKDELEELTTDPSTRRAATDWLMKVISAKEPINLHLNNGKGQHEATAAVAMREAGDKPSASKWGSEFTAEDLCGAPAVPIVKAPSPADSITADDVCWVPAEMRLKPQPAITESVPASPAAEINPPQPAPKVLRMGQAPTRETQPEIKTPEPEPRKTPVAPAAERSIRRTSLAAQPAMNHESLEDFVSLSEISREPAPYMVEPISASFSDRFHQPAIDEKPITIADIARDWVVESMEPLVGKEKDGVVLPFSFKVLKSKEHTEGAPAESEVNVAPTETPDAAQAEKHVPIEEIIAAAAGPETSDSTLEAEPVTECASGDSAPHEPVDQPEHEVAASAEAPAAGAGIIESQAGGDSQPDLLEIEAALETLEAAAPFGVAELEPEAMRMEAGLEPGSESGKDSGSVATESVFAHEGFWGKARAESGAEIEAIRQTPLFRDMEARMPFPPPAGHADSDKRPEGWFSAWKTLLRLGSVLPWIAQALPGIESGALTEQGTGGPGEMRQDVAGLRLVQYEIRTAVQDHSLQLKRMEEQLGRVRESLESKSSDRSELTEDVRSMTKLVRLVGIGLGGLIAVLIVLVIILLAHGR